MVPVEIPQPPVDDGGDPDGGSVTDDAGASEDAGVSRDAGVDAGVPPTACSVPEGLGLFVAKTTRQFVFPGCATATFSSEPGVDVVTTRNADGSATVAITPSTIGAWVLTLNANGSTQTRELLTDERFDFDGGFVRRYPDRVDGARTVMPSGRVLSEADSERLFVYGLDGGLEQTITIGPSWWNTAYFWSGEVMWLVRNQFLERWLDTPAGLVSTGVVVVQQYGGCLVCGVDENQVTSMQGDELVAFAWDGGVPSRQVLAAGLQLPNRAGFWSLLIPEGPEKVWADDFCSYEPGCTSTVCPAIQTCIRPNGDSSLLWANDEHALVYNRSGWALQLWEWPLSTRRELHGRPALFGISGGPRSKTGPILLNSAVEVVIHRNRIAFRTFDPRPLFITKHWVVTSVSPRELRFIPR